MAHKEKQRGAVSNEMRGFVQFAAPKQCGGGVVVGSNRSANKYEPERAFFKEGEEVTDPLAGIAWHPHSASMYAAWHGVLSALPSRAQPANHPEPASANLPGQWLARRRTAESIFSRGFLEERNRAD